jgi:hypothetical protein
MKANFSFFTLLFLLLVFGNSLIAQETTPLAKNGSIILENNQSIPFKEVSLVNGVFRYTVYENDETKEISLNEVKNIIDQKNSILFTNKVVVDRAKAKEEKLAEEQKIAAQKRKAEQLELEESKKLKLVPDGIYYTKNDFLNKTPNSTEKVVPKGLVGFEKTILNSIEDACFFYYQSKDNKIKKVFAIAYEGHLYFQIQAILSNRNKTDRAQTNDFPNSFVRVLTAGNNYYYVEATLVNQWVQGLAYNTGATGALIASDLSSANVQLGKTQNFGNIKGIVWDIKNQEFNIFKNCKDYNNFVKDIYPEGVQNCENHQPDIRKVRETIEKIK